MDCDLGAIHGSALECRSKKPANAQGRILGSAPEDKPYYDCVEQWEELCRAKTPDEPAAVQLFDQNGESIQALISVPLEGLPVETLRMNDQLLEIRLESGHRGWVDKWILCVVYMGHDPF